MQPGMPFSQAPGGGNTAQMLMMQMMMAQQGNKQYGMQQMYAPTNFYGKGAPMLQAQQMGDWNANPNLPRMQQNEYQRSIHNAAIAGSVYGGYSSTPQTDPGGPAPYGVGNSGIAAGQPGRTWDPRMRKAAEGLYSMGYINQEDMGQITGTAKDWDPSSAAAQKARSEVGYLLNKNKYINQMYGQGAGNTVDVGVGAGRLASSMLAGADADLGPVGTQQYEQVKGVLQQQMTKQTLNAMFMTDDKGRTEFDETFGDSRKVGAILGGFARSGTLRYEDVVKQQEARVATQKDVEAGTATEEDVRLGRTMEGKATVDPAAFKRTLKTKVKDMVDTFDALTEVYGEMDPNGLMRIASEITGLDPTNVRHTSRINTMVRQSIKEAESLGVDPSKYMGMIGQGAQILARSGYDQMASGMISQSLAGAAGQEMQMQRRAEAGYYTSTDSKRGGFRSMSMEDIHRRNMLGMAGVHKDKPLANATLGLVEALRNEELVGGTMSADNRRKLEEMVTQGPSSRGEMMEFARQLQDEEGINIMQKRGTMDQRMSMLQPEDVERLGLVRRGAIRATNRTQGFNRTYRRGLGLEGKFGLDEEDMGTFSSFTNQVGGEEMMKMMTAIDNAEKNPGLKGERRISAMADVAQSLRGKGGDLAIANELRGTGAGMQDLFDKDGALSAKGKTMLGQGPGANQKLKEKMMEMTGRTEAELLDLGKEGGVSARTDLTMSWSQKKADNLREMLLKQKEHMMTAEDEGGMGLTEDQAVRRQRAMMAQTGEMGAILLRDPEKGPTDWGEQRARVGAAKAKALGKFDRERKDARLTAFNVGKDGGFWTGLGEDDFGMDDDVRGLSEKEIDKRLEDAQLTRQDLRAQTGKIKEKILDFRTDAGRELWQEGKGRDELIKDDTGLLAEIAAQGEDEGRTDYLSVLQDTVGGDMGYEAGAEGKAKLGEDVEALRMRMKNKQKLSKDQEKLLSNITEHAMFAEGDTKGKIDTLMGGGIKDKIEDSEARGKAKDMEDVLETIEGMLGKQEDKVQKVKFEGQIDAILKSSEGAVRVVLERPGDN